MIQRNYKADLKTAHEEIAKMEEQIVALEEVIISLTDDVETRDDRVEQLIIEKDRLRDSLEEIREIWAGSEIGEPITAQEGYAIRLCKQMYKTAVDALRGKEG